MTCPRCNGSGSILKGSKMVAQRAVRWPRCGGTRQVSAVSHYGGVAGAIAVVAGALGGVSYLLLRVMF